MSWGSYWLSTHGDVDAAAAYQDSEEVDWMPLRIVDLDFGDRYKAERRTHFQNIGGGEKP